MCEYCKEIELKSMIDPKMCMRCSNQFYSLQLNKKINDIRENGEMTFR